MSEEISKDKEYKTRDGKEVRIYATDGKGDYPVHGAILTDKGWEAQTWTKEGVYNNTSDYNRFHLIEVPKTHKVWIEVAQHPETKKLVFTACSTKEIAETIRDEDTIEIIEREYPTSYNLFF